MATQIIEPQPRPQFERDTRTVEIVGAGSLVEAFGAAAVVVLAILGLAGAVPPLMLAVCTIVMGAALLVEGGAIGARYNRLLHETAAAGETRVATAELAGGLSAESIAGAAGVVLGILSLLGVIPNVLTPVALLAFGGGLLLGSAAISRLNALSVERYETPDVTRRVMRELTNASIGGQVLVGIGVIVLGILGLLGMNVITLTLVGLLCVGFSVLFSGSAIGGKMLGILRHQHC